MKKGMGGGCTEIEDISIYLGLQGLRGGEVLLIVAI